jgi:tRNA (guanine37-N1)-methyltransferase
VPAVLLSGDHGAIARWRRDEALRRTAARRPDLLAAAVLTERDRAVVADVLSRAGDGLADQPPAVAE